MQLYQKVSGEIVRLPLSAITRPTQYELCEFYSFRNPALKPGFQPCQGGVIENAAIKYPEAWAYLQTGEGQLLCKSEALTQAEYEAKQLAEYNSESARFGRLRQERDARIAATDYLMTSDYPLTDTQRAAVTAYRTALRDLPAQDGAPWDGGEEQTPWPEMPGLR